MTIRFELGAVRRLDHTVNMERSKNGHSAFVVSDDYAVATRRDIGVIHSGN